MGPLLFEDKRTSTWYTGSTFTSFYFNMRLSPLLRFVPLLWGVVFSFGVASAAFVPPFVSDIYAGVFKVSAIDTEHFSIEFGPTVSAGADADSNRIPDLVERVAAYAETSYAKEVEELGFVDPLANYAKYNTESVQTRIPLIMDDAGLYLSDGSVGTTSIDESGLLYMAISPTVGEKVIQATVAHEFQHVIQFSYEGSFFGYDQDLNFAEQIAVAVEDFVFDDSNDYYNYLSDYFDYPDYSVFSGTVPEDTLFEYGLGIWPRYLVELVEDWALLPKVVSRYFASDPDVWDAYQAYEEVLREDYDKDLRDAYMGFAMSNYFASSFYVEGESYPELYIHRLHTPEDYPIQEEFVPLDTAPSLFGTNVLRFNLNEFAVGQDVKVTFERPSQVEWGVIAFTVREGVPVDTENVSLNIFPSGSELNTLVFPINEAADRLVLLVMPLASDPAMVESVEDAFDFAYAYRYSMEIGNFIATTTPEFTYEFVDEPVESVEVEVSEDSSVVDDLIVTGLTVTNVSSDSVSLRWKRSNDPDVTGYEIQYESVAMTDSSSKLVEGAHITHATLSSLEAGEYSVWIYPVSDSKEISVWSEIVTVIVFGESAATVSSSSESGFSDVSSTHQNGEAIQLLTEWDLIQGYPDGTFRPDQTINRAELLKLLTKNWVMEDDPMVEELSLENCFSDVMNQWFARYVCYAFQKGWVQGYEDGLFHPERTVSRAEALKMLFAASETPVPARVSGGAIKYSDVFASAWYAPYVVRAQELGLLEEEEGGEFLPDAGRSRAQVVEEIYRLVLVAFEDFKEEWGFEEIQRP